MFDAELSSPSADHRFILQLETAVRPVLCGAENLMTPLLASQPQIPGTIGTGWSYYILPSKNRTGSLASADLRMIGSQSELM